MDAYTASLAHHPAERRLLQGILDDHTAHLAALTTAAPTAAPTATATQAAARALSLPQLAALERQAASRYAAAVERLPADCEDDSLVLLLASLAACEATHAALL